MASLLYEIVDPDPNRIWAGNRWDDDYEPHKKGLEFRAHEIRDNLLFTEAQMDGLKNDIGVSFLQNFPDGKWPKPSGAKHTRATGRKVLQPVMEKWGRAFNIPVSHEGFFAMLYDILKPMVSKSKLPKVSTTSGPLKSYSLHQVLTSQPLSSQAGPTESMPSLLPISTRVARLTKQTPTHSKRFQSQFQRTPTPTGAYQHPHSQEQIPIPFMTQSYPSYPARLNGVQYPQELAVLVIRKDGEKVHVWCISEIQIQGHTGPATLTQIDTDMVLASLIGSEHFDSDIDELAVSLPGHIMDSSHVNNTVGLVPLMTMAYNERCNPIIFDIVPSLPTRPPKRRHSSVVPLYSSDEDQPLIARHCSPVSNCDDTDTEHQGGGDESNDEEGAQRRDNDNNENDEEKAQRFDRVHSMDDAIASRQEVGPTKDAAADEEAMDTDEPNSAKAASTEQDENSPPNPGSRGNPGKDNSVQPIIQRLAEMAVGNDDITDIYNLSRSMDLAATANENAEGTNEAESDAPESDFADMVDWDLDVNMEQDHLGELEAAFNTLKDKCAETEHLTEDNWRLMNKFFKRNEKDLASPIKLPGLLRAMHVHQALLVTWCLSRHKHFHGGIIGDEQGLGKTFESFMLCWTNSMLELNHREVAAARAVGNHSHLPLGGTGMCPSALKWPFACSCEPGSPATEFGYRSGPNLIIVPPTVLDNWRDEFAKTFDPKAKNPMEVMIGHGAAPSAIRPSRPENLAKLRTDEHTNRPLPGQTRIIVLTTPGSFESQVFSKVMRVRYTLVKEKYNRMVQKPEPIPGIHCSWSFLFVDELHLCKSEASYFHSSIMKSKIHGNPWMWPMSGTPFESGPGDMISYIRLLEAQWGKLDQAGLTEDVRKAHKLSSVNSLKATQEQFDILQRKTLRAAKSNQDADLNGQDKRDLDNAIARFKAQLRHIMIRRTADSHGLDGKTLVPLPSMTYNERVEPPISAVDQEYLNNYLDNVQMKLRLGFAKAKAQWENNRSRGPEPAWPKHAFEQLQYQARPVCSFPDLGRLKDEGHFPSGWNLDELKYNGWFDKASQDSPIKNNIQRLHDSSAKLKYIDSVIKDMHEMQIKAFEDGFDEEGNPPKKEKLVILTAFPINALIIWEWLRRNNKHLKVALYGSHIPPKHRQAIIDGFQEVQTMDNKGRLVYKEQYHPDILVGTIGVLGTGLTLHYARRLIIFEPQHVLTWELQGMKRVHRIGQTRKVTIDRLVSSTVQTEKIIIDKLEMRKFIAKVVKPLSEEEMAELLAQEKRKPKRQKSDRDYDDYEIHEIA